VQERRTGTEWLVLRREGADRPVRIDMARLMGAVSRRHVEIMRDDLAQLLHDAGGDDVEYVFGDSVTSVSDDGEVAFERGAPRRFDLVIGADGLHSAVRRLVFGPARTTWLGGHLAVASVPDHGDLHRSLVGVVGVNRFVATYSGRHMPDARVLFLLRPPAELTYDRHDVPQQKALVRAAFADLGDDVRRRLDEMDRSTAFYFDSITQLHLDTWSRGRVALVGDAGYCPGPAVGGSTSMAVVGAYVLAGELALARGDHTVAFPAYERAMADYVRRSRTFARAMARQLIPRNRAQAWAMTTGVELLTGLPAPVRTTLARRGTRLGLHDSVRTRDYPGPVAR
jgi:2-polyprenyl-6-methoxyphenol hydroxylase-like FAD-dependent oxidoreductase